MQGLGFRAYGGGGNIGTIMGVYIWEFCIEYHRDPVHFP